MLKEMDHLQYSFRMRRWLRWRSRACDLQRFTISRYEKSFRGDMFDRCHQWEVHPWNQVSVLFYLIVADAKKACWVVLRPYFTDPGLNRPRNWLILSSNIVEDLDPAVLVLQPPPMAQVQACNQIGVSAGEPWDQTQWSWDTVDSQRAKLIHSIILHHFLEMFQSCGSHGLAGVFPSTVSPSATKLLFWCWKCWLRGSILDGANGPHGVVPDAAPGPRNVSWKYSRKFHGKQDIPQETGPEAWIVWRVLNFSQLRLISGQRTVSLLYLAISKVARVSSVNESHKPSWLSATPLHHSSCTVGCWHSEMQGLERCQFANEDGFLRSCQVLVGTHSGLTMRTDDGEPHQKPKYG